MKRRCSQSSVLLAIVACLPNALHAQVKHAPFMTATGAVTSVTGGQFDQMRVLSAELTLGTRVRRSDRLAVMLGGFAGSSVAVNHDEVTSFGPGTSNASSVIAQPGLSDFKYAGMQTGIETTFRFFALSVVTGPELFYSQSQIAYAKQAPGLQPTRYVAPAISNVGLHSRANASVLVSEHFAFVVSGTARYFPHFRNAVTHMNGLGLGFRVQ